MRPVIHQASASQPARLSRRRVCAGLLVLPCLSLLRPAAAADGLGLVTILDGEASLLRGEARFALAEGVRLQADDIVELGPKGRFLRIEFNDGASLGVGPESRFQLAPRLAGERGKHGPRLYLLQGFVKLSAGKGAPLALASSSFDLDGIGREAVISSQAEQSYVFVEAGELSLRTTRAAGSAPVNLKNGELLSLSGANRPELTARPTPAFLQLLPKPFLDSLPPRAALFQGKEQFPKRLAELTYAEAQAWIDAEPVLRRANLARWKPLANKPEFRKGLLAGLKAHPEWEPVLFPPSAAVAASR